MNIEAHQPSALLRPFIKTYLIIESQEALVNRVLPGTALAIAFRLKGRVNYITENTADALPTSVISGLRKSVRLINYLKDSATLIVLFKETGAPAFFREPLHELFEESVSLDNFVKGETISRIEDQLAEAKSNRQSIGIVEGFLLSKLCNYRPDHLVFDAVQKISSSQGAVKIKALADTLHISHDAFEKRFRRMVGTSPKQFSSIVRMQSVIDGNKNKTPQALTSVALNAGYFDQAHFNKDFKLFTGQTPTDFFKSPPAW